MRFFHRWLPMQRPNLHKENMCDECNASFLELRSMHLSCLRAVHSVEAAESESCVTQGSLPWSFSPDAS